ncbi:MAG: MDR family MFS transporter [Bacillota bacterium]
MYWIKQLSHYVNRFDRVVWLLVGAVFIESMGRFLVDPYLTLFLVDRGVPLGSVGVVLAAAPLASVLLGLIGGSLSDRWGRRPVQVVGVVTSGLALIGFGFVGNSIVALTLLNFANGMSRSLYRPAVLASLVDVSPGEMRSEVFGLRRVALNVGAAIGPVIGLVLYHWIPSLGFWIAGGANIAVGLYLAVAVPETHPARERTIGGSPSVYAGAMTEWQAWSITLRDGILWLWMAATGLTWGIYRLVDTYLPVHLGNQGVPAWVYGVLLPINAVLCVVVQLPLNYWLRQARIGLVLLTAAVPYALGFLGFGFSRLPALVIGSMLLFTMAEVLQASAQPRFIPELAPTELRGRYMGMQSLQDLGRAAVPFVSGWAMARWGGHTLFVSAAAVALMAGSLALVADSLRLARQAKHRAARRSVDLAMANGPATRPAR